MNIWALEVGVFRAIQALKPLTADQRNHAISIWDGFGSEADRVLTVSGSSATISVVGVLTNTPHLGAIYSGRGNTLYGDIMSAIAMVEADSKIKTVEFFFDSPGGLAAPLPPVGDAIYNMTKPTTSRVLSAGSAAYWLASQTDRIEMEHRGADVGNIGAVRSYVNPDNDPYMDIASSGAPKKRPDLSTPEGVAAVREELDAFEDLFVTAVAVGRDTTTKNVLSSYGQGGSLLAQAAIDAGMADGIREDAPDKKPKSSNTATGAQKMDLKTLKAEHPEVFAAAKAEGVAEGQTQGAASERDRIKFHLVMGEKCGALDVATKACTEGTLKDDGETMATYLSAGRNKSDVDDLSADETNVNDNQPTADKEAAENKNFDSIFSNVR